MREQGECYNCGPGAPSDDDPRFLCHRCAQLFEFNSQGHMISKARAPIFAPDAASTVALIARAEAWLTTWPYDTKHSYDLVRDLVARLKACP
jgi:hypothetical protein